MILRLLYGCGLRLGEALSLIVNDADWQRATLLIRVAKNNKQRFVPMHETLSQMLMQYCAAMNIIEKPDAFLFPGAKSGSHWSMTSVNGRFQDALKRAGVYVKPEKAGRRGRCPHCLRHLFAVKSFAQAEENGRPTNDSVPYLSVYLGHYDMDGTEKYLKFSSDIFPQHTEMFAAYSAGVFSVLGGAE
jgi:integrase